VESSAEVSNSFGPCDDSILLTFSDFPFERLRISSCYDTKNGFKELMHVIEINSCFAPLTGLLLSPMISAILCFRSN
jgi:hypothetical protein